MKNYQRRPLTVEAVQVTNNTFDAPHPNPEHILGALYDPRSRTVAVITPGGIQKAGLGDWIVRYKFDGTYRVYNSRSFQSLYEEVEGL